MSEEILKALVQLYAIITKQDEGVTEKERAFVIASFKSKLNVDRVSEYVELYDELADYSTVKVNADVKKEKLTSVKDSVKTLGLCKKINKTLTQKQKVVVLVELLELVKSDGNFTAQRMQIIDTVSNTFNIENDDYKRIENFVLSDDVSAFDDENVLIIQSHSKDNRSEKTKYIISEFTDASILFLYLKNVEMIFMKAVGEGTIILNGLDIREGDVLLFSPGSTVKSQMGSCFYYSDIHANFLSELQEVKLSFNVNNLEFRFDNGTVGLRNINISEGPGKLIGIMGASGAGKTTLLNVMAGLEEPYRGNILINGVDLFENKEKVRGVIGYISQDDILNEDLTVFENIYYNAKLCFKSLSEVEIVALVDKVLSNLGLIHIKEIQVGNVMNKKISGGQRKRLNIALELTREPSVLFVDEPTSGLSSRDSENVIDLLKELSLRGTLIFVVIHQPSSDIYKMFDKMLILDTGGYLIFNGHPVEAVNYFKKLSKHADFDKGQCQTCGNVNPEQIFNIVEEKVVDEYGNFTPNRKVNPTQWENFFKDQFKLKVQDDIKDTPLRIMQIPARYKQFFIYSLRDIKSKISNTQYMLINLIEAPLLAFILAFIIRYNNDAAHSQYSFRLNENIPAYILMSIVVALFMGLSVSAEELIKDRKILRRESFLNLSRSSYLYSKLFILFSFSAIQTLLFVLVGNSILEIGGMFLSYWAMLFAVSCMANVLGLFISSGFKTAITVYICIPLLLIPQMILSGAMFDFDKINDFIKNEEKVPFIADLMVSRWAYEGLAVQQFMSNPYEESIYKDEQLSSIANFNIVYVLPELREKIKYVETNFQSKDPDRVALVLKSSIFLHSEFNRQSKIYKKITQEMLAKIASQSFDRSLIESMNDNADALEDIYQSVFSNSSKHKDEIFASIDEAKLSDLKNRFDNESLSDMVKGANVKNRVIRREDGIIPKTDQVFIIPSSVSGTLDYRAHFFAPQKHLLGKYFGTYSFNMAVIWLQTLILYLLLYFDVINRGSDFF